MKQLLQLTQLLKTKLELVRTNKFNFNNSLPIFAKITLEFQMQTIRVRQIMTDEYGRLVQTDVNMRLVPVDFLLLGCPLESAY